MPPLAVTGIVVSVGFGVLAIAVRRGKRRWIFFAALLLAGAGLASGLAGFVRNRENSGAPRRENSSINSSAPPTSDLTRQGTLTGTRSDRRLWVLADPAQITEIDLSTFAARPSITIPPEITRRELTPSLGNAQDLQFNQKGQILFGPIRSSSPSDPCQVWLWDGKAGAQLSCPHDRERPQENPSEDVAVTEISRGAALSSDGSHLFWFSNERRETKQGEDESSTTAVTTFRIWQTDLGGQSVQQVESVNFPECKCETGACEETCPEGTFWAPKTGVDDFFLVTHYIPGQLQSEGVATFLYRKVAGRWLCKKQPGVIDMAADAAAAGAIRIELVQDNACCGWVNESSDQTVLARDGKRITLFDERTSYHNPNYDVKFSAGNARLSPNLNLVAMTIEASHTPGSDIRLSSTGKDNAAELAGIRQALTELPATEIVAAADPPRRIALVPHSVLVGWLNDAEILIVADQALATYNISSGLLKKTDVKVKDPYHVYLR
jgi:hypothetical protein